MNQRATLSPLLACLVLKFFSVTLPYFSKEALINPFKNKVLHTNVESKLYRLESLHLL